MTQPAGTRYKVTLENFAGPLDLLLYLIRKEEVDIHDIPIQRILDQYLEYLEVMKAIDLEDAGDFMVMASTLMVIKSKMLLPIEEVDLTEELDPRYELVQQLLEYKRLKTRAEDLAGRARTRSMRLGRPDTARPRDEVEEDRSLEDVQIWDLFRFFEKVISETTVDVRRERVIAGRQVPVREYASRLTRKLSAGRVRLRDILDPSRPREDLIGYFLAVLLLVKTQAAAVSQEGAFGDIYVEARADAAPDETARELELEDDFKD